MVSFRSRRGVAAAEFALAFPLALAFFFVLIDLFLFALRQAAFESAARQAARRVALSASCDAAPAACVEGWLAPRAPGVSALVVARPLSQTPASATGRAARRTDIVDVVASARYAPRFSLIARLFPEGKLSLRASAREVRVR